MDAVEQQHGCALPPDWLRCPCCLALCECPAPECVSADCPLHDDPAGCLGCRFGPVKELGKESGKEEISVVDLSGIEPMFVEAYAVHVIYGAMGVPMDDIFVTVQALAPDGTPGIGVIAKQDGREFTVVVGPFEIAPEVFAQAWPRACDRLNALSPEDRKQVADGTSIRDRAVEIFFAMMQKGFRRPEAKMESEWMH